MELRPDIINKEKSSSHKLVPGRIYSGQVKSVAQSGKLSIFVSELGTVFSDVVPLNTRSNDKYAVGDVVKCGFVDEFFRELIVYGSANIRESKFLLIEDYVPPVTPISEDQIILLSILFG